MQTEYVQLEDEIDRIVDQTRYNTMNILNGVGSQAGDDLFVLVQVVQIQVIQLL